MQDPGARDAKVNARDSDDGHSVRPRAHFWKHRRRSIPAIAQRLRDRFRKGGAEALPDYELLELVLFRAIPRRDTKDLAKRLLARFGSFAGVVNAPGRAPQGDRQGVGEAVVTETEADPGRSAAPDAAARSCQRRCCRRGARCSTICCAAQGYEQREHFRILFLDKKNRLIADEVQGQGTVDHTPVYVREVVKRALELSRYGDHPRAQPPVGRSRRRRAPTST